MAKDTCKPYDLENPSQPPKNEFAKGRSKSDSILKLEHFLKPCVLCDYKEKEKNDVIWSDLNLGGPPRT